MKRFLVWLVIGLCLFAPLMQARAQGADGAATVTAVDTNNFPDMHVYVSVNDASGQRLPNLPVSAFTLAENQSPVGPLSLLEGEIGVQAVFALDTNAAFKTRNEAGASRLDFIKEALADFAQNILKPDVDDVTVIAPEGDLIAHVSAGGPVIDALNRYSSVFAGTADPFAFASHGLDFATDTSPRPGMQRVLVLLSNGLARSGGEAALNDLLARAQSTQVKVYTVFVGPDGAGDTPGAQNLRKLAEQTGGAYYFLNGPQTLAPIFQSLADLRTQYRLSYRSTLNVTGQHTLRVSVQLSDGRAPASPEANFQLRVEPPLLARPALPASVERTEANLTLAVPVEVNFPDGHIRALREVQLMVDGQAVDTRQTASLTELTWPLAGYSESLTHTLQIRLTDELGLSAESEPVSVWVSASPLAAPAPTLAAQQAANLPWLGVMAGGVVLIALAAAAGTLWMIRSRRKPQPPPTYNIEDTLPGVPLDYDERLAALAATTPSAQVKSAAPALPRVTFPGWQRPGKKTLGKAYFEVVESGSGDEVGEAIEILGETVRVGRDPQLAEIVFSERSVSRLHARVCETAPGLFQIFDEGSTSGTWVNFTQVAQEVGRELHPGDLINLGRVQLRFQMRAAPGGSRSAGQPKGKFTPAQKTQRSVPDDTEPYRPVKP